MRILAIESSCDETSASVVEKLHADYVHVLSNTTATSLSLHAATGGIIPENAAREQIKYIIPTIVNALCISEQLSDLSYEEQFKLSQKILKEKIDQIAVTIGPGLIGSLLVGIETAKSISFALNKPLIPVNHLLGHIYANFIQSPTLNSQFSITFPCIALIVSGAHTDLLYFESHNRYTWLGGTRDDAAGECFDKCARLLGYNYPGGPKIAELAQKGNVEAFQFPRPMIGTHSYEFSFSGLKTSFLNATKQHFPILRTTDTRIGWQQVALERQLSEGQKQTLYDLCAGLEYAIVDVLVKKTLKAAQEYKASTVLLAGGVAANQLLRDRLQKVADKMDLNTAIVFPEKKYCTDNAAMIGAWAAFHPNAVAWQKVTANPELYFE